MTEPSRKFPVRAKHVPWLVISLILVIMTATVVIITINLRRGLRTQIIQQDGIMLYAASMVPANSVLEGLTPEEAKDPEFIFMSMMDMVLNASKQKGVLALQVFDKDGEAQLGQEGK